MNTTITERQMTVLLKKTMSEAFHDRDELSAVPAGSQSWTIQKILQKNMRKILRVLYASGILVALAMTVLVNPIYGIMILGSCIPLVLGWPVQSVAGLQAILILFTLICLVGTMLPDALCLWAGVVLFAFLAVTVRMGGGDD